ncbi:MAG: NHLP family bacteriocin export ABC transporter peptidase/permease/ATPase subunit [Clostridium sp.]|jgi:NHLM bacteriocin system ABC transporter peptidase/ATP-binding protein|nr:NHLP family bacteriocin export ABC transporter peptidase/permease/ATPase subunit [Clostridium sp.]
MRKQTPVIMQMEALECGAACLAMILAHHGRFVPLAQLRSDCGVSRDGSKAQNILRAARAYGLTAKGMRLEPEEVLERNSFPCIVHWDFNHFVVVTGLNAKYAFIHDPGKGEIKILREEFERSYTGVVLFLDPNEDFEKGGKPASIWGFVKERLLGTQSMFLFLMLISVLGFGAGLLSPTFSRVFVDYILPGKNPGIIAPFFALLAVSLLITVIISYLQAQYLLKINGKLAVTANAGFMWHVLRLPIHFFSQRNSGDLAMRKSANEGFTSSIMQKLAPALLNGFIMIFYLFIMIRYSIVLTIIGVLSMVINLLLSRLIAKKNMNISRVRMRAEALQVGSEIAGIQMIETLKATGAEDDFFEKWASFQAAVGVSEVRANDIMHRYGAIPTLVQQLCNAAVLILGVYLCFNGEMTLGLLLAFQTFMTQFQTPAMGLIEIGNLFTELRVDMERVEDVMKSTPDIAAEIPEAENYEKLRGEIILQNVTFGYSKLEKPILCEISIHIKPGEKIAIVGASGCGKSTITKLISGLYEPWSGEITYDGKKRSEINRNNFTSSIAVVDQEIIIFGDTIANNIKLWDHSIEDFEMILAARDASLHSDILERDGGYNSKIAEGGRNFSGGQCQRLEIARVLAADPTIIILDEATSALDAKTENEVMTAVKDRGITCIVIAHRLSTIRDCDEIIVLDHGEIVERGKHEELMTRGQKYHALVTSE